MTIQKGVTPKAREGDKVICHACGTWVGMNNSLMDLDGPPFRFYCDLACFRADHEEGS